MSSISTNNLLPSGEKKKKSPGIAVRNKGPHPSKIIPRKTRSMCHRRTGDMVNFRVAPLEHKNAKLQCVILFPWTARVQFEYKAIMPLLDLQTSENYIRRHYTGSILTELFVQPLQQSTLICYMDGAVRPILWPTDFDDYVVCWY